MLEKSPCVVFFFNMTIKVLAMHHYTYIHTAEIPSSSHSVLVIQSMFNLCLLLNRGQLAFIALPFQARFGANLFSVDIKGQFTLLFGKYFSNFFLNSHNNVLPAIRKQNGKHFNRFLPLAGQHFCLSGNNSATNQHLVQTYTFLREMSELSDIIHICKHF